jgi:hypothetical protein
MFGSDSQARVVQVRIRVKMLMMSEIHLVMPMLGAAWRQTGPELPPFGCTKA